MFERKSRYLLRYNKFDTPNKKVNCILFLSEHYSKVTSILLPDQQGINRMSADIAFTIFESSQIISFQVMDQLKRTINAENVILVADDVAYEKELNELDEKGVDLIILKQTSDKGSRMYTPHRWGDIAYSLGHSIGLKGHEL